MITYINGKNFEQYSVLFKNATQALIKSQLDKNNTLKDGVTLVMDFLREDESFNENGELIDAQGIVIEQDDPNRSGVAKITKEGYVALDEITSLEKYFYYLRDLVQLGKAGSEYEILHSEGRRYTILPTDEDNFLIDANARLITVPPAFAKNGVGVQGDELSEVLYFEIDRYFDAMDLDTADIYIEWTRPDGQSGVSKPWVIDIESQPNKIIFGWALSSSITKLVGALKFAVRFFQWADDNHTKLGYSWATQPQTVTIKSTLDFTLGSDDYMAELGTDDTILNRIQNSETYVTDNGVALEPIYLFNLEDNLVNGVPVGQSGAEIVYIDLVTDPSNQIESYPLKVQAYSPDAGVISYTWSKSDQGPYLGTEADSTHSEVKTSFELTEDTSVVPNKMYYEKVEGNIYKAYNTSQLMEDETPASKGLYEKFSICIVKKVGDYFATATNRVTQKNSTTKKSTICRIPEPVEPTIDTPLVEYAIIPETDDENEDIVILTVEASNNETNGSGRGTLSYTWWYKEDEMDEYQEISLDEPTSTLIIKRGEPFDGISYHENRIHKNNVNYNLEGYYMVKIKNHKNMVDTYIESAPCHVTFGAEAPILSFPTGEIDPRTTRPDTQLPEGSTLRVEISEDWINSYYGITDSSEGEGFTYQWFKPGDNAQVGGEDDIPIEGATNSTYTPLTPGMYFCVVTNHKNHDSADTASKIFSVAT